MMHATTAYSGRATEYAAALGTMEAVHPSDRVLVETWAGSVSGPALDAGCGPGHWTNHLAERGLDVRGIDLTPEFIYHARSAYPGVRFDIESIDAIHEQDGSLGGILSWYSTIHHAPESIARPIAEFARTLQADGLLLLGYFEGPALEAFDHAVSRAWRWPATALARILEANDFEVIETHRRTGLGCRPHGATICRRR